MNPYNYVQIIYKATFWSLWCYIWSTKNERFCSKIEQIQYNAALAVTGAIRGTSQTKLYN